MKSLFIHMFLSLAIALFASSATATPQGSAFTYQGRLEQNNAPANGSFDFSFRLFTALSGGTQVGSTVTTTGVVVSNGLFNVALDFGIGAFDGNQRFLQVTVGTTTLSPRTELTSAPYANAALTSLDAGMAQSTAWRGATHNVVAPEAEVSPSTPSSYSVAIGADGLPIIAYYAVVTQDLKVAVCHDPACDAFHSVTLDSIGDVGDFNSIAIGVLERPVISYYDRTNGDLKFARCVDAQCSAAATSTVDTLGDTGQFTAITVMNGGVAGIEANRNGPLIAYYDNSNHDLRYLRCDDADCATPTGVVLDATGDSGQWPSIVFDGQRVQVAYQDVSNKRLKLAICSDSQCGTVILRTLDSAANSGFAPSLALTPANRAIVAHNRYSGTTNEIVLARCNGSVVSSSYCDTPAVSPLYTTPSTGIRMPQLLLGRAGTPLVWDGQFGAAGCEDYSCTIASSRYNVPGIGSTLTVTRSAATTGADGLPVLVYQGGSLDGTPRGIKLVHCASATCRSYGRDR